MTCFSFLFVWSGKRSWDSFPQFSNLSREEGREELEMSDSGPNKCLFFSLPRPFHKNFNIWPFRKIFLQIYFFISPQVFFGMKRSCSFFWREIKMIWKKHICSFFCSKICLRRSTKNVWPTFSTRTHAAIKGREKRKHCETAFLICYKPDYPSL